MPNRVYPYLKTAAPAVTDDTSAGYKVGDTWLDTTNDKIYQAIDVSAGAAIWIELVGRTQTQTLTGKTLDLASNTLTGTKAQFNTALSDGDFASQAGSETLTNKTIDLASNTLTGTTAQFNTALSDNNFATTGGAESLSNKTIDLTFNTLTGTKAQFNTALSDGDFASQAGSETLTNKTIVGTANTISEVAITYMMGGGVNFNPADSTTYYTGLSPSRAPSTGNGFYRIPILNNGTIIKAAIIMDQNGTTGTSETSTASIRLNDTSDTTISALVQNDQNIEVFTSGALSIAVVVGDFLEIKWVTPAWVTNPTAVRINWAISMRITS